jgi:hypothetical protein
MSDEVRELAERIDALPEWSRGQAIELIRVMLKLAEPEPSTPADHPKIQP